MTDRFRPNLVLALLVAGGLGAVPARALTLLTDENAPFNFTEKGTLAGSGTEIVLEMARRAGVPARTEVMPWESAYVRTQASRDTCLFSTARLENRERLFVWVGPIATNLWAVYGRGDFALTIRTLKDLSPYRIGTVARDAKQEYLRENGVNELRPVRTDAQNPPRLALRRDNPDAIDLWITDLYSGRELAKAAKVSDIKLVFIAFEEPLFLACSPQTDGKIVKALADALEGVKADGTYKRITESYEKRFPQ
jgi:polar amino acid transport system substrate-binding protein